MAQRIDELAKLPFFSLIKPILTMTLLTLFVYLSQTPWTQVAKPNAQILKLAENYMVLPPAYPLEIATVEAVIDGDTFKASGKTIRMLGIDTPETNHPRIKLECYGLAASEISKKLLTGKTVFLESDVENKDMYNRFLRYVYLASTNSAKLVMVNALLVGEGYAQVYTKSPNVKYLDALLALQNLAREQKKGLWGQCSNP